ncbi:monoacylglycerol lipase ABHD12-like protein [Lates japonicus]|uniref:Monoacylglycerol lipase ABHD12-like protein n=1 Tax=Lates japonicus TaxID=270547 RepID=A0AAD3MF14_LATJO|nr:monoacylglycerol lipase ABHD12-like protein [Lates japonicus]
MSAPFEDCQKFLNFDAECCGSLDAGQISEAGEAKNNHSSSVGAQGRSPSNYQRKVELSTVLGMRLHHGFQTLLGTSPAADKTKSLFHPRQKKRPSEGILKLRGDRAQRKEGTSSGWWLKRGLLAAFVIFILLPFSLRTLPELIQHLVYTHRIRVPFFADLGRPADLSLNHTINMYLTSEEGISLGVWHTVPESQWKEAQGKDLVWYQNALNDGSPVFIYLHGNTGTRAATHRVGVAKVLSALGYHVLVPDYRGFGDSTGEPTEAGLTTDALHLYNWVKARSGNSLVVIWGHSLGTGVATNTAVKLVEQGVVFDGVILEGAFNSARQKIPVNPFIWYYWKLPGTGYLFPEPWAENKVVFPTEENLKKKMKNPILFPSIQRRRS